MTDHWFNTTPADRKRIALAPLAPDMLKALEEVVQEAYKRAGMRIGKGGLVVPPEIDRALEIIVAARKAQESVDAHSGLPYRKVKA